MNFSRDYSPVIIFTEDQSGGYSYSKSDRAGKSVPFGQITIIGLKENAQKDERRIFRDLEALERGFSLQTLGAELIRRYKSLEYARSAQILFVTAEAPFKELKLAAPSFTTNINICNMY